MVDSHREQFCPQEITVSKKKAGGGPHLNSGMASTGRRVFAPQYWQNLWFGVRLGQNLVKNTQNFRREAPDGRKDFWGVPLFRLPWGVGVVQTTTLPIVMVGHPSKPLLLSNPGRDPTLGLEEQLRALRTCVLGSRRGL